MDEELANFIKEMCSILTGNTYETLSKEDYKRLESIALYVGQDCDVLNAEYSGATIRTDCSARNEPQQSATELKDIIKSEILQNLKVEMYLDGGDYGSRNFIKVKLIYEKETIDESNCVL